MYVPNRFFYLLMKLLVFFFYVFVLVVVVLIRCLIKAPYNTKATTDSQAPFAGARILLNPQLFLSGYGFRPHESVTFRVRTPEWKFLNPPCIQSATQPFLVSSRNAPPRKEGRRKCTLWGGALRDDTKNDCVADYHVSGNVWTLNADIFLSTDVIKSSPVLYREYLRRPEQKKGRSKNIWIPVDGQIRFEFGYV